MRSMIVVEKKWYKLWRLRCLGLLFTFPRYLTEYPDRVVFVW